MNAMVIFNIAPDAGLANCSRGIITDIIMDPKEIVDDDTAISVHLECPPVVILFRPFDTRDSILPNLLQEGVPIFSTHKTCNLGGKSGVTIDRKQFALTPG